MFYEEHSKCLVIAFYIVLKLIDYSKHYISVRNIFSIIVYKQAQLTYH